MYPNSIYIGLNVVLYRHLGAEVYTVWAHGPLKRSFQGPKACRVASVAKLGRSADFTVRGVELFN